MLSRRAFYLCATVPLLTAALTGCGDSYDGRKEVAGSVTLQGQPLKEGAIQFEPLDNQGTQSGGPVSNGEYRIPRQSGLKPGKYLVRITAGDGKTPADEEAGNPGGSTNIVSMDLIPPDWNVRSTQQVEVRAENPNRFDFAIPRANAPRGRR